MNTFFKPFSSRFIRSLVPAAIVAAAMLPTGSAVAEQLQNGLSINGIGLNGVQLNGLELNGLSINGVQLNGVMLNGLSVNGMTVNGITLNGHQFSGIDTGVRKNDIASHLPTPHCTQNPNECFGWMRVQAPADPFLVLPGGTVLQLR